jgi:hypothetical protein
MTNAQFHEYLDKLVSVGEITEQEAAARRARNAAWERLNAANAATPIVGVRAEQLGDGRFRYFGTLADGSEVVLRKSSTRKTAFAHFYAEPVASGASGLAAHFGYSDGRAPRYKHTAVVAVFEVA